MIAVIVTDIRMVQKWSLINDNISMIDNIILINTFTLLNKYDYVIILLRVSEM